MLERTCEDLASPFLLSLVLPPQRAVVAPAEEPTSSASFATHLDLRETAAGPAGHAEAQRRPTRKMLGPVEGCLFFACQEKLRRANCGIRLDLI